MFEIKLIQESLNYITYSVKQLFFSLKSSIISSKKDKVVALVTESSLLTPLLEVPKWGLSSVVDMSTPQIVREPVIKRQDKNWRRFLTSFGENEEKNNAKAGRPELVRREDRHGVGRLRFELCYVKDWEEAGNAGKSWVTTSIAAH